MRHARLTVQNLSIKPEDPHGVSLNDISLDVRGGEVFGIAGVAGNGQDEFFAALSGETFAPDNGVIVIDGHGVGGESSSVCRCPR